jgi:predicted HAD superfamily Cof-like phosphohydrolase
VLELHEAWSNKDIVEVADAITDCLYILFGTAIEFGLQDKLEDFFDEVHGSNMSKLDENGKPIYRNDGKVLKSEKYYKPDLKKILDK